MELSVDPVDAKNIAAQGIRASKYNAPAKFVTAISRFEERLQSDPLTDADLGALSDLGI